MPHSSHRTRSVGHSACLQQLPATRACGLKVVSHPTVHRRIEDLGGCNVFPITLPPLRHRKEDLPLLGRHFVRRYAEKYGKHIAAIPAHPMTFLLREFLIQLSQPDLLPLLLGLHDDYYNNNARVQQWNCTGAWEQEWVLVAVGSSGQYFRLVSNRSTKCMEVRNASPYGGAQVDQYEVPSGPLRQS